MDYPNPNGQEFVADALARREMDTYARSRGLNRRDGRLAMEIEGAMPPMPPTPAAELLPEHIQQLGEAITQAKTPVQKEYLMKELERLKAIAAQLNEIGQKYQAPAPVFQDGMQNPVFRPDDPMPQLQRGPYNEYPAADAVTRRRM